MSNSHQPKATNDSKLKTHHRKAKHPIRTLLIQPPSEGGARSLLSEIGDDSKEFGFKPPLGILYVATTLKERSIHDAKVIDAMAMELSIKEVVEQAREYNPDVVGISAWTDFWYPAYKVGEGIKKCLPNAHLVYGGPHIGIYSKQTLALPFVDSVIAGD